MKLKNKLLGGPNQFFQACDKELFSPSLEHSDRGRLFLRKTDTARYISRSTLYSFGLRDLYGIRHPRYVWALFKTHWVVAGSWIRNG